MGKGDDFERENCRYLSLWWTEGERDDIFWRNRVKVTSKTPKAEKQLGDITATHTLGLPLIEIFNIEVKTGYSKTKSGKRTRNVPWDILDIIDSTSPKGAKVFVEFWKQTIEDAQLSGRIPMLIFKRDFHVPVVAMYYLDLSKLEHYSGYSTINQVILADKDCQGNFIHLFRRDDFFTWLNPDAVKLLHKDKYGT